MATELDRQARDQQKNAMILLDVMLPDISGFEVCQTLRAHQVGLPILMLTALGNLEDRVSGLRLGADDYLSSRLLLKSCWRGLKRCGGVDAMSVSLAHNSWSSKIWCSIAVACG